MGKCVNYLFVIFHIYISITFVTIDSIYKPLPSLTLQRTLAASPALTFSFSSCSFPSGSGNRTPPSAPPGKPMTGVYQSAHFIWTIRMTLRGLELEILGNVFWGHHQGCLNQSPRNCRQSPWYREKSQPQGEVDIREHRKKQKEMSTLITLLSSWNKPYLGPNLFLDFAVK